MSLPTLEVLAFVFVAGKATSVFGFPAAMSLRRSKSPAKRYMEVKTQAKQVLSSPRRCYHAGITLLYSSKYVTNGFKSSSITTLS